MTGPGPLSPEAVMVALHSRDQAYGQALNASTRRARSIDLGTRQAELHEVWDLLAELGVASPRIVAPTSCETPCAVDGHYLTVRRPDGTMHSTVHVEGAEIATQNDGDPDQALETYRHLAKHALVTIDPPDRSAPSPEGHYVMTPPAAATVSAPSIVEITDRDRGQAWADFHRAEVASRA